MYYNIGMNDTGVTVKTSIDGFNTHEKYHFEFEQRDLLRTYIKGMDESPETEGVIYSDSVKLLLGCK